MKPLLSKPRDKGKSFSKANGGNLMKDIGAKSDKKPLIADHGASAAIPRLAVL